MKALATTYRPHKFEDVTSQGSIIKILKRQLATGDIKNCYLFCGASGCGKTTIARIFADEINKHIGSPIEIDAASNNGVDNVRQIIRSAYERSIDSEYKVYIIDETHALSSQAWQSFLKCIEEPPKYTIFIFCTTEPQKIPATILNRVMRFNFSRIDADGIKNRLKFICDSEGFINYEDSIDYISRICKGGMRDAIALLDKASSYSSDLCLSNVLESIGTYSYDVMFDLLYSIETHDEKNVFGIVNYIHNGGSDLKVFSEQFLSFVIDVEKYAIFKDCGMTQLPINMTGKLEALINIESAKELLSRYMDRLLELKIMLKNDTDIKSTVEVVLVSLSRMEL